MTRKIRLLVPALLFAATAPALQAQAVQAQPRGGPSIENAAVGIRGGNTHPAADSAATKPADAAAATAPLIPRREDTNQNRALMIVGGAALIVGAIIGKQPGTIIMVGGAGLGLYGLYKYLE